MATLRELLDTRDNDYTSLEVRYRELAGAELVTDPYGSFARGPALTRSASVLIGTFDSGATLVTSLRSIEASSFNRSHTDLVEAIVVDDGSTDGTRELVLGLDLDLRIQYVRQANGGLTRAHNTGAAFSEADILIFSDSDMVHTPHAIEELMKRHQLLDAVTLIGFRFEIDAADPGLLGALPSTWPRFAEDFRMRFPGRPTSMCRETRHLKDLGFGRSLLMANGARYGLPAMVVGAFFSIERAVYEAMGGSDERLVGWGCEDSLIGARSIAMGGHVIPVYGAASGHVSHGHRQPEQSAQFARNVRVAQEIHDQELDLLGPGALRRCRARALEHVVLPRSGRPAGPPPAAWSLPDGEHGAWGDYHFALGQFRQAAVRYERAAPATSRTELGLGRALRELGDLDESIAAFTRCLAAGGDDRLPHYERGLSLARLGRHHEALADVRRAASLFDADWTLRTPSPEHKRRANSHAGQSLHGIARTDFDLALIADPVNVWAHFDLARSLRELGLPADALRSVERAERLLHPDDGNRAWIHAELGILHLELGDDNRAMVELEAARVRHPGNHLVVEAMTGLADRAQARSGLLCVGPLQGDVEGIPGWLSPAETDLLVACVRRAASLCRDRRHAVVELGSYCGKSTVVIASALRAAATDLLTFHAIDPHSGYQHGGSLETHPLVMDNLRRRGLAVYVDVIRGRSTEVAWASPIALLFIDAMHEYEQVRADFEHFAPSVVPSGLVAFHDYADHCPGVQRFVNELLLRGELRLAGRQDSVIVLERPAVTPG